MPSIITWTGSAPAIAQISDFQFSGTWEATDVIVLEMNGKTVSVSAGSTTIATIINTVVTAWNALTQTTYPEFAEVTASLQGSDTLRLTADTAGKPFSVTVTTTETGGGSADSQSISSETVTQASSGPEDVSVAGNYSTGALPTTGDTLVITDTANSLRYNLDSLSGVTLASLIVNQSFTGDIGLPNYDDAGKYYQYRPKYFQISATSVQIGAGNGQGSGRIKLDLGSAQSTINVMNTGNARDQSFKALVIKGTHASNAISVLKGSVDVAPEQGDTSTMATVAVSFIVSAQSDSDVRLGGGVTLTNVSVNGGNVEVNSATTSLVQYNGTVVCNAGAQTAVKCYGGTFDWRTTSEITNLTASNATVDLSHDIRAKNFNSSNAIQLYRGAVLKDPAGVLPANFKVKDNTGGVTLTLPPNKTYTVA